MRKPLICAVAPLLAAATVSCSMISGYSTDEAASYARAVELVKTNVDTDKFKIYSIDFFEREALSDDLFLVSVKMVNRETGPSARPTTSTGWNPPIWTTYRSTLRNTKPPRASTPERSTRKRSPLRSPGPRRCCPRGTPSSRSATTR